MASGSHTWFAFDLDYTLIRYKTTLHSLIFESCIRYLVEYLGYYKDLFDEKYDKWSRFVAKGIVIDEINCTMIQLDRNRRVMRATKGTTPLTTEEIARMYPDPLVFGGHSEPGKYFSLVTGFEMPIAGVFALISSRYGGNPLESELTAGQLLCVHLRDALNFNFLVYDNQGWFFSSIRKDPLEYVLKRDDVRQWLEGVRKHKNCRLMLITNSMPEYTNLLMSVAFGEDWKGLFDLVLVRSRKPYFFSEEAKDRRFVEFKWDSGYVNPGPATLRLSTSSCFCEGNSRELINFLNTEVHAGEVFNVLYFGDHMVGDVQAPRMSKWKTVAIVEELEHQELHGVGWVHSRTLTKRSRNPLVELANQEHWTPYLTSEEGPTFWGAWAQEHADVIVPCLSHLDLNDLGVDLFD